MAEQSNCDPPDSLCCETDPCDPSDRNDISNDTNTLIDEDEDVYETGEEDDSDEEEFNLAGEFQEDNLEDSEDLTISQLYVATAAFEDVDEAPELEFEYEPGISLGNTEFGQAAARSCRPSLDHSQDLGDGNVATCFLCGVNYETGRSTFAYAVHVMFFNSVSVIAFFMIVNSKCLIRRHLCGQRKCP